MPTPAPTPRRRLVGAVAAATLALFGSALAAPSAVASAKAPAASASAEAPTASASARILAAPAIPSSAGYTVSVGSTGSYPYADDTPAGSYIDKDGTFYFQESHSLYGATDSRQWSFYTGSTFDDATLSTSISNAVNPANASDSNADTTWRCDNSPTGLEATSAGSGSGYAQPNYCDLVGVWVDPDTGTWYGLVHNEFTPQPFGDGLHYDSIDYAQSTNQGRTWTIEGHAITSPYSTTRNDNSAFPNQTYDYGDGDPRLYVDTASGYFYVYYGSRIVPKAGTGGSTGGLAHVARAPISGKMATGSWSKWYDGTWSQPGVGGLESNMVPATAAAPSGWTPVAGDYSPATTGSVDQQVAAGELPSKSSLFIMNIAYDAYLGLYIGEPEVVSGTAPQQFYVTDDLSSQKWYLAGDSGGYTSGSWYRWFVDSVNRTGSTIIGKSFRSYCAIACASSDGEYANVTVDSTAPAAPPLDPARTYRISSGDGLALAQVSGGPATTSVAAGSGSTLAAWAFAADGDGSYRIVNAATGQLLGVDSSSTAGRAWGAAPTATASGSGGPSAGQQWFIVPGASAAGAPTGDYRLVNRYSGLVIGLSSTAGRLAETTPARYWTDSTGSAVGGSRTAAQQTLTLTAVGSATGTVSVGAIGAQSWTQGAATSLQVSATASSGSPLSYQATGLPAGLSINSSTGLVSGTPTSAGTGSATVTATAGTATGTTSFAWTVQAAGGLTGAHTLSIGGKALDDPNHSRTAGTQLITWTTNGGANQSWQFTRQADGSYQLRDTESQLCADVSGGSSAAGAQVIQWTCTGSANQSWQLTRQTDGSYTLAAEQSGLLLTTASSADGSLVTQQAPAGAALQHWTIG
ncbi:RICIN domain-containing protein [Kitasatospora sp. NBC_01287]|uniref:RICIN domain-containing protein n=1 Tax=Kitasatospora sp. NBC_01287 TaxID=2903573 RepID=UPI002252F736|nr:RICIN domain-containing protein [Kitasatospora sp. NBC_01287]MCX4751590.1 RICIN domain-containing protein [Kitasatospora sp. NBC_01287]